MIAGFIATLFKKDKQQAPFVAMSSVQAVDPLGVMTAQQPQNVTMGVMAHIDAGKITTTERTLHYTRGSNTIGEVQDRGATLDGMLQVCLNMSRNLLLFGGVLGSQNGNPQNLSFVTQPPRDLLSYAWSDRAQWGFAVGIHHYWQSHCQRQSHAANP